MMVFPEVQQPLGVGLVLAASVLQMLTHGVRSADAAAIPGKQLSEDFITLRYHSRTSRRFLTDACLQTPETCTDLRLWECTESPPDMRVPYTAEAQLGVVQRTFDTPMESAGGSRLLLSTTALSMDGRIADQRQIILWSGCNSSCADCAAGTGRMWVVDRIPSCTATASGGATGIMYNSGNANSVGNCVSSLDGFSIDADGSSREAGIFENIALVAVLAVTFALSCICVWLHRYAENAAARSLAATRQGVVKKIKAVISRETIEENFPVCHSCEENTCVVCLEGIEHHDRCRRLQCGHEFHAECIADWWTHQPRSVLQCPLCRQEQRLGAENPRELPESPATARSPAAADNGSAERQTQEGMASTDLESGPGGPAGLPVIQAI